MCSLAGSAWLTHVLEGIVCFIVAYRAGIPAFPWFVDASLVGAGATSILFDKLRIAKANVVTPVCIGSFALIALTAFNLLF